VSSLVSNGLGVGTCFPVQSLQSQSSCGTGLFVVRDCGRPGELVRDEPFVGDRCFERSLEDCVGRRFNGAWFMGGSGGDSVVGAPWTDSDDAAVGACDEYPESEKPSCSLVIV
jgi:hypothetical protein